ncbi:16S rRNA methyltransferase [Campylobacter lari]|uniref:16S rRNA (cytosine(1402)-N(4))-methyltransferase RsmH n=1 Tax=Campylobacter lari TaxID=201 RepID=UPI0006402B92|nr:16S rRNA (cytosine(1402)-N(4))-methyltransferase RsmH [Campylobacter lari]AKJ53902.1 16S rRNA methyltransferase [Campylobacter lari]MBT0822156.1 16S rRNA (cytosine(1402)-N(4))-methyltransferase RsmH [Campylobacter lari]MBT0829470.1 16S rRNA (cytosine(1402)-N(4))-methyltransferase RsmH [Campylobacter lari]
MQSPHIPVLLQEVLDAFDDFDGGDFLDCTLGYGGHSKALLQAHEKLRLIACDKDLEALNFSKDFLKNFQDRVSFNHIGFKDILTQISTQNLRGILADIGVSSLQLDKNDRGFSLNSDFLDMRMDQNNPLSAKEVVNFYSKEALEQIFKDYGDLTPVASMLAQKIINARSQKEIVSAKELSQIIGNAKLKGRNVSLALLVFQALRIEVNNELGELKSLLENIEKAKLKDCKLAIISFHSLEDRIVKNTFKRWEKDCICDERAIKCECGKGHSLGKILSKKAISASKEEISYNSRSSCAKMRIFYFR